MVKIWVILTILIITIFAVSFVYFTRKSYKTVDSFLTARGRIKWGIGSATVFASIMGGWILFTPAEAATWGGLTAFIGYACAQAVAIMFYCIVGPRMRKVAPHGTSITEFVYYRYGKQMYILSLIVSIFYMMIFLACDLTGIALAVNLITGFPLWLTALLVGGGTLIYTTYGGLRGSVFTDTLQTLVILPTLIIAFFGTLYYIGGADQVIARINEFNPALLGFGSRAAWEFTISLFIAIVAANAFHQGFWSRVYACDSDSTVRKSFLTAGLLIIPVMALAGSFGLMAVATGQAASPSVALFEVILNLTPAWVIAVVIVLAVALCMSSVDTTINGIASVCTVDVARFKKGIEPKKLMVYARTFTLLICVISIGIASQGFSVVYLFLVADVVASAAVFPTFFGLYSPTFPGWGAALSTVLGIIGGAALFPPPDFSRGNLLAAIVVALVVSLVLSLIINAFSKTRIDFEELGEKIQDISA